MSDSFAFHSIVELGVRLRTRQTSAIELAEFYLDRLKQFGPRYNAIVRVTSELALAQARQADAEMQAGYDRGPMHGIPFGVKDLLATKGIPTTWGAAPLQNQVFDEDATVIVRLREAGAVLCAKLAMVELAGGFGYKQADATFSGPGLNPWDKSRWAGGSSSGSASAVGAGLVPFAIGSETLGSIVTPACYCGVAGLRPTYGRVSRHGAMALSWTLDKLGPLCRTSEDCGLVLDAIAGADPSDDTCIVSPWTFEHPQVKRSFRFAVLDVDPGEVQPEVFQNYEQSLKVLEKLGSVETIELPDLPYSIVASTIISSEMSAAFETFMAEGGSWELTAPEDRWGGFSNLLIPAKDYINAMRIRRQIQREINGVLANYDAIVTPTLNTEAGPIIQRFAEWSRGFVCSELGSAANLCGLPALTLPNGFGEDGLPTGIEFTGRALDENTILSIGCVYQEATDWHENFPSIAE